MVEKGLFFIGLGYLKLTRKQILLSGFFWNFGFAERSRPVGFTLNMRLKNEWKYPDESVNSRSYCAWRISVYSQKENCIKIMA